MYIDFYLCLYIYIYVHLCIYIYIYMRWYLHLYIEQRDLTCFEHQTMGYEGDMIFGCWLGCKNVNCLTNDVSLGSCLPFRYHFFVNPIPRMFLNSFRFYPYVWSVMLSFSPLFYGAWSRRTRYPWINSRPFQLSISPNQGMWLPSGND